MRDPNASAFARLIHEETRDLVQKAAGAPYGEGVELVRRSGYWRAEEGEDAGLPTWHVEVDATIAASTVLEIQAETADEARKLARDEMHGAHALQFDDEHVADWDIRTVKRADT